ncbi:MAG: methionine--tRNA ligase [Coriobacteriales bacterium]|jgi:methionyl-tRNA synthetase
MAESFSITTPIYYVNDKPHLGTAYTTVAADSLARFERMDGKDVFFLTGLDEHGQKVAESAEKNGMSPQEWCDIMAPKFEQTWRDLLITNDDFIRTTEPRHIRGVQAFWTDLYEKGWLYKAAYSGWYCVHEETYYTESEVVEIDGQKCCPECHRPLRYNDDGEENWFFKLSEFQEPLLKFYDEHPDFVQPTTRRNEVVSFVKGGLKDLSISRTTFDWGVPLPFDEGHVTYVWIDALLNYITAMGYGGTEEEAAEFKRRWPVQYHFVGKDIIRFHCVIWPAMLMAAGLPLPQKVFAHGFLLTKGEKMSKSTGNAVAPADLVKIFGIDAYRYYFMTDVQFGADGSISMERMVQVYNADLANTWGNLCSRAFNMAVKYFDGKVPQIDAARYAQLEEEMGNPLHEIVDGLYDAYSKAFGSVDFSGAAAEVAKLSQRANAYIEESAPWNLAKDESKADELAFVIYNTLEAIRIIAICYAPWMPVTSQTAFDSLGLGDVTAITDLEDQLVWGKLPAGNLVTKCPPMFPRLNLDELSLN